MPKALSDAVRDTYLKQQGFRLMRFWNNEILINPDGGRDSRSRCARTPSPQPLSRKGRGALWSIEWLTNTT